MNPDLDDIDGLRHCGTLHHHHPTTNHTETSRHNTRKEADKYSPQHIVYVLVYPELHRVESIRNEPHVPSREDCNSPERHPDKAKIQIAGHPVKDSPFLNQERYRRMNAILPKNYKI